MAQQKYYRDQQEWRDLQTFLPTRLHLNESNSPTEEFWDWRGNAVHLDRYQNPRAKVRVVLLHGIGTNGRQMSMVLGGPLAKLGYDVLAPDNLGYGLTKVRQGFQYGYADWVQMVVDLLAAEAQKDERPVVLYGLSAGGLLTYHVAAAAPRGAVQGIVGMTFLDPSNQQVKDEAMHDIVSARLGAPLIHWLAKTPLRTMRYPMGWAIKMRAMVNNKAAMDTFMRDKTSAGNAMPIYFLSSFMRYVPAIQPEAFDVCPVLLTQPAADRWTPRHLSDPVLSRIQRINIEETALDNASHYPVEDPGLQQLVEAVDEFAKRVAGVA